MTQAIFLNPKYLWLNQHKGRALTGKGNDVYF